MPHFYITGFQMRQFQDGFSKISFDREGFQKLKTEKKQIKCYKKKFNILKRDYIQNFLLCAT